MSRGHKWLTLSMLTMALGLAAAAAPAPVVAQQPKEVEVALVVPLSGPWARQGVLERMGAEMAIDDINKSGGIKSVGGAKMKLIVLDTGDSAEKAKNAAQRLVAQNPDVVGGIGAWLSSFTLAVTEVTERAELPWLTLSYSDVITGRGFHYVFQTSATADRQAELALPTIMELAVKVTGKKPTSTGVIQDNTASPVSFMKPMRAGGFEKAGLKVLVDEIYTPPLSDATPLVSKVRTSSAHRRVQEAHWRAVAHPRQPERVRSRVDPQRSGRKGRSCRSPQGRRGNPGHGHERGRGQVLRREPHQVR